VRTGNVTAEIEKKCGNTHKFAKGKIILRNFVISDIITIFAPKLGLTQK
jgi:hypothetical protein